MLVLSAALGLHWSLLQSIAWTGMLFEFAADSPVSEALERTFDGKHPCRLCKLVREGREKESRQAGTSITAKLDPGLPAVSSVVWVFDDLMAGEWSYQFVLPSRTEPPALPPPQIGCC